MRYVREGAIALAKQMPGRSWRAIARRAERLGGLKRKRRWAADDDRRLRMLWDSTASLETIATRIGRTVVTTYCHAQELGLPLGVPNGFEYFSEAARRTGFDAGPLWAILSAAEVPTHPVRARPTKSRRRRYHYVDPFDVDRAVEAWLALEVVESAARRIGVCGENLRRWLRDAGHARPARRHVWRLAPEEIDRVVGERRGRVSIREACAQLGVIRYRLEVVLRRHGVPRGTGKLWLVTLDECRRALGWGNVEMRRAA